MFCRETERERRGTSPDSKTQWTQWTKTRGVSCGKVCEVCANKDFPADKAHLFFKAWFGGWMIRGRPKVFFVIIIIVIPNLPIWLPVPIVVLLVLKKKLNINNSQQTNCMCYDFKTFTKMSAWFSSNALWEQLRTRTENHWTRGTLFPRTLSCKTY